MPHAAQRLCPVPVPANIPCAQPGGGWGLRLALGWGRLRRAWLRRFRPGYVTAARARRTGDCPGCPHDILDERDLTFHRNVCGYRFEGEERRRLPVAPWGRAELLVAGGGLAAAAAALAPLAPWAALPPALLALFVAQFFRDPHRSPPAGPGLVVAPADGRVTHVEELAAADVWDGPALKVSVYLSLFDVHVNRAPETARVVEVRYRPGAFANSWPAESAAGNEQFWTLLEGEDPPHPRLLVKQVAGAAARRIVNVARPGEVLRRGQRLGMIKFGSRTELYLAPVPGLRLTVRPGDRVRGGETVVARYG